MTMAGTQPVCLLTLRPLPGEQGIPDTYLNTWGAQAQVWRRFSGWRCFRGWGRPSVHCLKSMVGCACAACGAVHVLQPPKGHEDLPLIPKP